MGLFPAFFAGHIGFGTVISVSLAHGFARGRVLRQTPTDAVRRSGHNLTCHVFYVVQSSGAHLLPVACRMDLSFIRSPLGCVFFGLLKSDRDGPDVVAPPKWAAPSADVHARTVRPGGYGREAVRRPGQTVGSLPRFCGG